MTTETKLVGFEEWRTKILALPDRIGRNVLRGAVNASSTVVRNAAKQNEMRSNETGVLQNAIYQKQIPELSNDKQQIFHIGWRKGKRYQAVVRGKKTLNLDAYYGMFLELGTSKMYARPFMRPALASNQAEATEAMRAYLEKRIPEETRKLGL